MILFSFPPCSVRLTPALVYGGSNGQMIYPPLYYSRAHTTLQRDCKITNFFSFDQIFPIQNHHTPALSTFITMTYSTLQHHPKTPTTTLRTTKTPPQNTSYQQPRHHFSPLPRHPHRAPTQTPRNPLAPSSLYKVQGSKPLCGWFKAQGWFKVQSSRFKVQSSRFSGSKFKVPPYTAHLTPYATHIKTSTHVAQPLTHAASRKTIIPPP